MNGIAKEEFSQGGRRATGARGGGLQVWDMDGEEKQKSFPFIDGKEQDVIWTEQLSVVWLQPLQSCFQTSTNSSICFVNERCIY